MPEEKEEQDGKHVIICKRNDDCWEVWISVAEKGDYEGYYRVCTMKIPCATKEEAGELVKLLGVFSEWRIVEEIIGAEGAKLAVVICPKCDSTIIVREGYDSEDGFSPLLARRPSED